MATIAENLQTLITNKADIKTVINSIGDPNLVGEDMSQWATNLSTQNDQYMNYMWNLGQLLPLYFPFANSRVVRPYGCYGFKGSKIYFHPNQTITELGSYAFASSTKLEEIQYKGQINTFPDITTIGSSAFGSCYKIKYLDFGSGLTSVGNTSLTQTGRETGNEQLTVIFRSVTPPTFGTNVFGTAQYVASYITFAIYVPDASVAAYKAVSNLAYVANYIHPLSEYAQTA